MKSITLFLCLFVAVYSAGAQSKLMQTVKIKTPGIQCDQCKSRIESYLSREEGIGKIQVDLKKKIVTVTFSTDRTNIENIKTAIANCGYDADDVKAEEEAYQKLPKCCKKKEDVGGHP